ncbi:MAG: DUF4124 domain-containing protein [Pseudomonadota bacterium]
MKDIITYLIAVLFVSSAEAQEFYKWVDEDGVTHYGEVLPSPDIAHEEFDFPAAYETSNPTDDYYSIQNQLKRVQEQRLLWRELNVPVRQETEVVVQEVQAQPEVVRYVPAFPFNRSYNKDRHYKNKKYKYKKDYKHGKKHHNKTSPKKPFKRDVYPKLPGRNPALIVKR